MPLVAKSSGSGGTLTKRITDPIAPLTHDKLRFAAKELAKRDPDLAVLHRRYGAPPMWGRRAGFATLIRIILEQQVSLASARAIYKRLQSETGRVTPASILDLSDRGFRNAGLTRQKTAFCRATAEAIVNGNLDLRSLRRRSDAEARAMLLRVKGVGPWTADIFLLMALKRPDVWPVGDLALDQAVAELKKLRSPATRERSQKIARQWSPWRSVAARMLWQAYLMQRRGRKQGKSVD